MKIGAFITVRLGSKRLPNKALLEIKKKPTIVHLIDRIKYAKNLDKIVLCTTTNPEDKKLIKVAEENNISYFAGDEKDVIKRHLDAAIYHEIDFVINIDGDDLFCDPEYVDKIAKVAKEKGHLFDIIETKGLPFGVNSFGYKIECLRKIFESKKQDDTDTGWGEFFRENTHLKKKEIPADENHVIDARMSLDYEEDFQFFKKVIGKLYKEDQYFSLEEIFNFLKKNPEIIVNKEVIEKYWKDYEKKKILKNRDG
ncbi:hypothetical protein LCGC14_1476180 [marine sediment metagenome]|uniref:Acylneuraminate cytidylyltransferase n=1 Tax=marine sediment metagenome TaxID=412755 RepID=A0A0F9JBM0_9ZZZZ